MSDNLRHDRASWLCSGFRPRFDTSGRPHRLRRTSRAIRQSCSYLIDHRRCDRTVGEGAMMTSTASKLLQSALIAPDGRGTSAVIEIETARRPAVVGAPRVAVTLHFSLC